MNVLFLADRALPDAAGGAQTVAWELARHLVSQGHGLTILTPADQQQEVTTLSRDGITLIRHRGAGSLQGMLLGGRRATDGVISRAMPHLVHSHFAYAELGARLRMPRTVPWIRTFHGPWDEEGWVQDVSAASGLHLKSRIRRRLRRWIERLSLRHARRIIVLSEFARAQALARGAREDFVRVVPGGTDVERFHPRSRGEEARARLGLPEGCPLLFTLRRLVPRMGLEQLIRAIPLVLPECPGVKLVIGGDGPDRARLERIIRDLGLQETVTLVGYISDGQVADYHRAADLFVLPTSSLEGFGLVTVDALACGTPVLGTPAGATPEILAPLDGRLLTPGTTSRDLAEGILRFWKEDWRTSLPPARLHAFVRDRYTWDRHAAAVSGVHEEVLHAG